MNRAVSDTYSVLNGTAAAEAANRQGLETLVAVRDFRASARIGSEDGPGEERAHQTTHVVYDARSGRIVATHHFISAAASPDEQRISGLKKAAHEASRVPLDHLAILTNPDLPRGEGELRADHTAKRLVRSGVAPAMRIKP